MNNVIINLNQKKYNFLTGYQKDSKLRASFNQLAINIFNLSFESWYQAGYWNEKYIPYTLFDEEKAVANISVNIMDLNTLGESKRYIQLGTVMTDIAYRNQGLSRFLMEHILNTWNGNCDFIYLFANHTVLDMYPKFDFIPIKEQVYYKSIHDYSETIRASKLNMDIQTNRDFVYDYAKQSCVFGKMMMQENADLVMFYCISFLKDHVYYIKSLDAIAIATFNHQQLQLWDVFSKQDIELDEVIRSLIKQDTNEILLGFTPKDTSTYQCHEHKGDETLFIQKGKAAFFENNQLMFPLLSHA